MGILNFNKSKGKRYGVQDPKTGSIWATPWSWRDDDGCYVGVNNEVWLYRELKLSPIYWEDPQRRIAAGEPLKRILAEIGATSLNIGDIKAISQNREIHILSVVWDDIPDLPMTTQVHTEYLDEAIDFLIPNKSVVIGIKLRSSIIESLASSKKSPLEAIKTLATNMLGEGVPNLEDYQNDRRIVNDILRRHDCVLPTEKIFKQIESWYNNGKGPSVEIYEAKDEIYIDGETNRIELAVLHKFNSPIQYAPDFEWLLRAATHPSGTRMVSIRGELEPLTMARNRARKAQKRAVMQISEQEASGDFEKIEDQLTYQLAKLAEDFLATGNEPLLSKCSIIMARRADTPYNSYITDLRDNYDIDILPLEHRQMLALDETLPCSDIRINPHVQDLSVGMISYAGLQDFSILGDKSGVLMGLTDPNYTPCWLDINGAANSNKPPAMAIFGEPGSGKTYIAQSIATQAALMGEQVIFINPKGYSSLSPFAEYAGGRVVKMSALESTPGFFDPFRYAHPELAAEIATNYILTVLGQSGSSPGDFSKEQERKLAAGLKRGAMAGARCVAEALQFTEDADIIKAINDQCMASSTFALGIGVDPRLGKLTVEELSGLTLIEFDRKLNLPEKSRDAGSYTRDEKIALAAIRLVSRASLEMLSLSNGGVFILDEAWTFLSSSDGLSVMEQLGREGRSLNILPIFITQRVLDLVKDGVNMDSYLSRVLVLKLTDEREAAAALQMCGLEVTTARLQWLRSAGPVTGEDGIPSRPSRGLHRDLNDRHAAVIIGPVPEEAHMAFTTNPLEINRRDTVEEI